MRMDYLNNLLKRAQTRGMEIKQPSTGALEIMGLKEGQVIKARIASMLHDIMMLELENGKLMEAKYTDMASGNLVEGQKYQFVIKTANDKQIVIQPILEDVPAFSDEAQDIARFLEKMGMTPDQEKIELVKQLIKYEIPVNERMLYEMNKLKHIFEKLKDLLENNMVKIHEDLAEKNIEEVFKGLLKDGLPISVRAAEKHPDHEHPMKNFIADEEGIYFSKEQEQNLVSARNGKVAGQESTIRCNLDEMNYEKLAFLWKHGFKMNIKHVSSFNDIVFRKFPIAKQLESIMEFLAGDENTVELAEKFEQTTYRLKEGLLHHKRDLQEILKELYAKAEMIKYKLESLDMHKHGDVIKQLENLKNGIDFIGKLNQWQTFLQIPIAIGNDQKNLEIFIGRNSKKSKKINPHDVKIFVSLDTKNMDVVQVLAEIQEKTITCNFRVANEQIKRIIKGYQEKLAEKLKNHGFVHIYFKYAVSQEKLNLLDVEGIDADKKRNFIDLKV